MQQAGHNCTVAEDGVIALEKLNERTFDARQRRNSSQFDVVLMDIEMPRMNGFEATQKIREREQKLDLPRTIIIGLSGNAKQEYAAEAVKVGMNDYMVKPFNKKELMSRIQNLIQNGNI